MGVLESVLAYKQQKDAQAAADIQAIPQGIAAFTAAKQVAQKNLLDQLTTQATLQKLNLENQDLLSKQQNRQMLPDLLSKLSGNSSNIAITGASLDENGELKYTLGETPQSKDARELKQEEEKINMKAKVPTSQQKSDLQEAQSAVVNIDEMKKSAEKLPSGYGAITQNVMNFFSRGETNPDLLTYNDSRPAIATGLYRTLTGDKRLSDQDAKSRALPLLWDSDEGSTVRTTKFEKIKSLAQARERLIRKGEYTIDKDGQFITPLESVKAEAEAATEKSSSKKEIKAPSGMQLPKGHKIISVRKSNG